MTKLLGIAGALVVCCTCQLVFAQETMSSLPVVKKALNYLQQTEPEVIEEQIKICHIPAPPFKEDARIAYIKKRFTELGLENVFVDPVGNVIAGLSGKSDEKVLVLSAHLDTVFPEGTEIKVERNNTLLTAPGISDDSRGLAVLLAVARVLKQFQIQTEGSIYFVATVGEEGLGNLRGVRHLFEHSLKNKITHFISIDDVGLHSVITAVGSHRYKVLFKGSGGHSYADFGIPNPIHALGRAIAGIADFQVPSEPKATFAVGRSGGGTSVNSIAHTAWMEVDMRSESVIELEKLDSAFHRAVYTALSNENARWAAKDTLTVAIELLGKRPAGAVSKDGEIATAVKKANKALDIETVFSSGSTDANIPISLGIEALTIGGGGSGTHKHSLKETFNTKDSYLGTQRTLLIALEIVGVQ